MYYLYRSVVQYVVESLRDTCTSTLFILSHTYSTHSVHMYRDAGYVKLVSIWDWVTALIFDGSKVVCNPAGLQRNPFCRI